MAQCLVSGSSTLASRARLPVTSSNGSRRLSNVAMSSHGRRTTVRAAASSGDCRPIVGYPAPDFEVDAVYDQEFVTVKLSDYAGQYVVVFFYPLDFTFVCPTEIIAFSDRNEEFKSLNCQVLGASCDSKFSHLAWIQTERTAGGLGDLEYPLISDIRRTMARDYNVLLEEEGHPHRGLFIIDKEGVVQHATINNNPIGRNVDEVLRTLKAIQHVQENPDEVCPAGWEEGDDTINPDPKKKLDFFAKV